MTRDVEQRTVAKGDCWRAALCVAAALWFVIGCRATPRQRARPAETGTLVHRLTMHVGDVVEFPIPENPTTGYRWAVAKSPDPEVVEITSSHYEGPREARPGAGGMRMYVFRAVGRGRTELVLDYRRPWMEHVTPRHRRVLQFVVE